MKTEKRNKLGFKIGIIIYFSKIKRRFGKLLLKNKQEKPSPAIPKQDHPGGSQPVVRKDLL